MKAVFFSKIEAVRLRAAGDRPLSSVSTPAGRAGTDFVLFSDRVADRDHLVSGLKPGARHMVAPSTDTLRALQAAFADIRTAAGAAPIRLHIVGHGAPGRFELSGTWLSLDDRDGLTRFAAALAPLALDELVLYGCETGRGPQGRALVAWLEARLGCPVRASETVNGRQDDGSTLWFGGDDRRLAFTHETLRSYPLCLPVFDFTNATGTVTDGSTTITQVINDGGTDVTVTITMFDGIGTIVDTSINNGVPASPPAAGAFDNQVALGNGIASIRIEFDVAVTVNSFGFATTANSGDGQNEIHGIDLNNSGGSSEFQFRPYVPGPAVSTESFETVNFVTNIAADNLQPNLSNVTRLDITNTETPGNTLTVLIDSIDFTLGPSNNAPAVDLDGDDSSGAGSGGYNAAFTEAGGAVAIADSDVDVTDGDADTITTITITLTNDQDGASEGLNVTAAAQDALTGISGASDITLQDTISITGATATLAEVETFLQAVTYNNTSNAPNTTNRTVTVVINDGTDNSTSVTTTVSVTDVTAATSTGTFDTTAGSGLNPGIVFGAGDETLTIANTAHVAGSTANGGGGTDTLVTSDGIDLNGLAALTAFETLNVPASTTASMSSSQHNAFSTFTDNASQTIGLSAGSDNVTGNANIETYTLGASYSGVFTIGAAGQNVTGADGAVDTVSVAALTATGTLNGGTGTDVLQIANGGNIAGATVSAFETLELLSGASVTMTEAQHDAFSTVTATGTDQITISAATDGLTGAAAVETYVLGAANSFTLGADAQNVTGSTGNDTVDVGTRTATGTLGGGTGTDTLTLGNGADVTGATVSSFENLTLADNATATLAASQLAQFSGTVTANASETITVSGDGDFTTLANVETFSVGDDSSNTRTVTLASAAVDVTANSGSDAVTFNIGTLSYTGTLTGNGADDIVRMGNGSSIANATLSNVSNLTVDPSASVTMTEAQHDGFAAITATGTNQITISAATDGFSANAAVETYVLGVANSVTLGTGGGNLTQNITGSTGNDTVTLGNGNYTGTLNGNTGTGDTLSLVNGSNAGGATVSNFENLTIADNATVTLAASQLAQFSGTVTANATETIAVSGDGDFTTLANVETYSLGNDSTNTRTVTVGQAGVDVTASAANDAVTFDVGTLTYTGTITGEGTTNDTIRIGNGGDITGATLNNIEVLALADNEIGRASCRERV